MATETSKTLTLSAGSDTSDTELGDGLFEDAERPGRKLGSRADLRDMMRMGRRQELSRNFNFLSIVGFSIIAISTWIPTLQSNIGGTENGGLANVVWVYVVVLILWCSVVASIAEMASMAPTSGGQYVWVSEFAPPPVSRALSYVTGWLSVLGWQMAFATISSGLALPIQNWLQLTGSTFVLQNWHASFILIGVAALSVCFNTNIANSLPLLGGALAIFYICAFFAVLIPLWVLSPLTPPEAVFLSFSDRGGPGGVGYACVFGTFSPVFALMAPDAATHMSEEIKNSSLVLPRAMMASTVLNGILGLVMVITLCFTVGDLGTVLSSDIGVINQVILNSTGSTAATLALSIIMEILSLACAFAGITSASRQLFAFARDNGVPFSSFLAYVRPGWNIPLNALLASFAIASTISLINIGASRAVSIATSVAVTGNLSSYIISISCVRLKRWRNEQLPSRHWSLGRWGAPINDLAILFLVFLFVIFLLPYEYPVTADNMNYAVVVWGAAVVLSLAFYFVKGRHTYISPVSLIRKDT